MTLSVSDLRSLIDPLMQGPAALSQNEVARRLGIEPSALSRWLQGGNASYPLVVQVAESLGVPPERLWKGQVPRRYAASPVPRGTHATVREPQRPYPDIGPGDERGGLWVIEQMSLALADIARRLREATAPK